MSSAQERLEREVGAETETRRLATLFTCWTLRDQKLSDIKEVLETLGLLAEPETFVTTVPTLPGEGRKDPKRAG